MARKWTPREHRLVAEWIAETYPTAKWKMRVRLGPTEALPARYIPRSLVERILRPFAHWADAVILLPDKVIIVEAKIVLSPRAIGELELYEWLFKQTPEYRPYWDWPIEKVLLYALEDERVIEYAKERGIKCIKYCPPWAKRYLLSLATRMVR